MAEAYTGHHVFLLEKVLARVRYAHVVLQLVPLVPGKWP
jgi:hypothetical protein